MQDCEIIELYFARDEQAIVESDNKYGDYCRRIALNILSDIHEAEECKDDTYVSAWNAIPPKRPTLLGAFLAKITKNIALDRYRERNAKKRGGRHEESLDELGECIGDEGITSHIESEDIARVINKFLSGERELMRRMFVRRYFYEDSISEIAQGLGQSEARVKTTLFRQRQKLSLLLKKEGIVL